MPREVIVSSWCDACFAESPEDGEPIRTPAQEARVAIGNLKPRLVLLCERHEKEMLMPLYELITDLPPDDNAPAPTERRRQSTREKFRPDGLTYRCKWPGCDATSISPGGMQQHYHTKHPEASMADLLMYLQGRITEKELLAGGVQPKVVTCTVDGCDRTISSDEVGGGRIMQALASHRRASHNLKGPVLI